VWEEKRTGGSLLSSEALGGCLLILQEKTIFVVFACSTDRCDLGAPMIHWPSLFSIIRSGSGTRTRLEDRQ
jgi:hypothetical protein